jgi:uncharacterized protein YjiK
MGMRAAAAAALWCLSACSDAETVPGPATVSTPGDWARSAVVAGYDLGAPRRSYVLPPELMEISAVAAVDDRTVACLHDEKGVLFLLDLDTGRFTSARRFSEDGDYEGLARVGDGYWVLRSDGQLTEVRRDGERLAVARTLRVAAPQKEFEGLAYDATAARLVVAPKTLLEDKEQKQLRPLYAVDPATGATAAEPALVVDREQILAAAERLGVDVPSKTTRRGLDRPLFRLRFAEVAVQPGPGHYWLLSAIDRALVVVDRTGAVVGLHFFSGRELPQPEAATFLPSGDLVLASEGDGGPAALHVYGAVR